MRPLVCHCPELQALTGIADPAIATAFTRRFVAHADQVMHGLTLLYPWVAETVLALRAAGQRLGIVSRNIGIVSSVSWLRAVWPHSLRLLLAARMPQHKPNPAGLLLMLQRLNYLRQRCSTSARFIPSMPRQPAEPGCHLWPY